MAAPQVRVKGACWIGGRFVGSRSASSVAILAGAIGKAVSVLAAADSSPKCARATARSALRCASASGLSSGLALRLRRAPTCRDPVVSAAAAASRSSCTQQPRLKSCSLRLISSVANRALPGARNSSIRGASRKSFQPLRSSSSPAAEGTLSIATRKALRSMPRSWRGGDCKVYTRFWISAAGSTSRNSSRNAQMPCR